MRPHRPELDGLRALAVIPVILFHANLPLLPGGYVGVDVFFVLSGYLIGGILLGDLAADRFSLATFYERRARRILPALALVLLATLPAAWAWLPPSALQDYGASLVAVSLFLANLHFQRHAGYFATDTKQAPLLHTWSLGVEEQFYLVMPLLLLVLWKRARRVLLPALVTLFLASLMFATAQARQAPDAAFFDPRGRAWELLLGVLLAQPAIATFCSHLSDRRRTLLSWLGLSLILWAVVMLTPDARFPGPLALIPTIGAALVIATASRTTGAGRLLATRPLVGIGLVSYSAYLWHQPIFAFARLRAAGEPTVPVLFALALLTLLLAAWSWRYVEQPFRDRTRVPRRPLVALASVTTVAFATFGAVTVKEDGFPARASAQVLALEAYARMEQMVECPARRAKTGCVLGSSAAPATIALWGDSHAAAIAGGLSRVLERTGHAGRLYWTKGCPPALGFEGASDHPRRCLEESPRIRAALVADTTLTTVLLVARWPLYVEETRFDNGAGGREKDSHSALHYPGADHDDHATRQERLLLALHQTIRVLEHAGKRVLILYPIPELGWAAPERATALASAGESWQGRLDVRFDRFERRTAATYALLDRLPSATLVRVLPEFLFCDTFRPDYCIASIGDALLYRDDDHLSPTGADLLAGFILPALIPDAAAPPPR